MAALITRRNAAADYFSILPPVPGASLDPVGNPRRQQQIDLLFLRMKRTLADLVHDYGREFIDANIDPMNSTTLVDRLLLGFNYFDANYVPTQADQTSLRAFYTLCTTDAQAKKHFKLERQRYMDRYNISEPTRATYSIANDGDPGTVNQLWDQMYADFTNGVNPIYWYLDAQAGNPIKDYERWLRGTYPQAMQAMQANLLCKDLAYETDPATKWQGADLIQFAPSRFSAITMPGYIIGAGADYGLSLNAPPNQTIRSSWTHPNAAMQGAELQRDIDNYNNSIERLMAAILGAGDINHKTNLLLRKPLGDAGQGYSVSSTLWAPPAAQEPIPLYVTNDILENEDKEMYHTGSTLLTGPTELTYVTTGAVAPITQLNAADSASVRANLGNALTLASIDACIVPSITEANNYFETVVVQIAQDRTPRFRRVPHVPGQPIPGPLSVSDTTNTYHVIFQQPGDDIILAHVVGLTIDLVEKSYMYDIMLDKAAELRNLANQPAAVAEIAGGAVLPIKYRPFVSPELMRQYLGIYSIYKPKVLQGEINTIFTKRNLGYDKKDGLYNELVNAFTKFVTVPNIPKHLLSLFFVVSFLQLTMPVVPVRPSPRAIEKHTLLVHEVTQRSSWIANFFRMLNNPLNQAAQALLAPFYGANGVTIVKEIQSFGLFLSTIIRTCFSNPPTAFLPAGVPAAYQDITYNDFSTYLVKLHVTPEVKVADAVLSAVLSGDKSKIENLKKTIDTVKEGFIRLVENLIEIPPPQPTAADIVKAIEPYKEILPINEITQILKNNEIYRGYIDNQPDGWATRGYIPKNGRRLFTFDEDGSASRRAATIVRRSRLGGRPSFFNTGGAYGNEDQPESEESEGPPDVVTDILEFIDECDETLAPGIDIYDLQRLIAKNITYTSALDTDTNAYSIYALSAVSAFESLHRPEDIVAGYTTLLEHPYVSNGLWDSAYRIEDFAKAMASLPTSWPTDAEVAPLHIKEFKEILDSLLEGDVSTDILPFLAYVLEDPLSVPDYQRLYTLTPEVVVRVYQETPKVAQLMTQRMKELEEPEPSPPFITITKNRMNKTRKLIKVGGNRRISRKSKNLRR